MLTILFKSLWRDWRCGELTLLALALVIGITCITTINNFSNLIYYQLNKQSANLLGADRILSSSLPIPLDWQQQAKNLSLKQTITLSFLSMVENNNQLQLAQIKSVTQGYPLYGDIKLTHKLFGTTFIAQAPPRQGTIWVSSRLLPLLNVQVGDKLTIGQLTFKIDSIIVEEPGQAGDWFNLSPRIIMNYADVIKTEVVQPGSNISYRWLLAGPVEKLNQLNQLITPSLTKQQSWTTPNTANKAALNTLESTLIYIHMGTLMSLLLAGVAINMATLRYTHRHQQQVALLRCFGLSQGRILALYLGNIIILGLIASLIGIGLGYALQPLLIYWLKGLFAEVETIYFIKPLLLSLLTGLGILLSFALPNLIVLSKVSAMHLFRLQFHPENRAFSYTFSFLFLALLAYLYTSSWSLTLLAVTSTLGYVIMVFGTLFISFTLVNQFKLYFPLNWRFGFTNIQRNLTNSTLQIVGIGLSLTALLTLTLLKNNLLHDWQQQLPLEAPNFFAINIEPEQVKVLDQFLHQKSLTRSQIYPMVRGRISTINNQDVNVVLKDKVKKINALQRELNFSWADQLPEENKLIAGIWNIHSSTPWISIEESLAKNLNVGVGDKLGIRLGDTFLNLPIANIRAVNWINLKPNFFILFQPDIINSLPKTFIVSFYLPPEKQDVLLELIKQFPNITLIDVADTIKKIQTIFTSAGKGITLLTLFSLLAGITITLLTMLSFYDLKQQETYLLKILGMRQRHLLWIRNCESFILGFFAGLLAITTAFAINYYLNSVVLKLPVNIPWRLFLLVPLLSASSMLVLNSWVCSNQYQKKGSQLQN